MHRRRHGGWTGIDQLPLYAVATLPSVDPMIEVSGLTKTYRKRRVLADVSFACTPGRVTGFLGPNGAGKSTTMRVVAGLTRPDSGTATVGGHRFSRLPSPGQVLGVLLDTRALSGARTGAENLWLAARYAGVDDLDVTAALDRVGLDARDARRRVADYSLGMRQRLGIAQALVARPQGLMLDEPANGLDPAGIVWMRELLRGVAADGGTVLLSSHLLHEVERSADDLVLIDRGHVVASGTVAELTATGVTRVRSDDQVLLGQALRSEGLPVERDEDVLLVEAEASVVGAVARTAGVALAELGPHGAGGLEELFMSMTTPTEAA